MPVSYTHLDVYKRQIQGLACLDGTGTDLDLQMELTRMSGDPESGRAARYLIEALSKAGFLCLLYTSRCV